MSDSPKLHKIEVKSKDPTKIMTGSNAQILIDGTPLKYATSFAFSVDALGVAKATIELIADVAIGPVIGEIETNLKTEREEG
jgi:hypothetical protein